MDRKRRPIVIGLDAYGLAPEGLYRLGEVPVEVEAHIRNSPDVYPSHARFRKLLAWSPEERRAAVRRWRIRHHDKLCAALSPYVFAVLRFNGDPVGVRVWLPAKDVRRVFTGDEIECVKVLRIKGTRRKRVVAVKTPKWFAVKARFAKQIEGETKGMQTYEDRIVLVLARSSEEAEHKAMREFRQYEAPSLTTIGHFYRWGFEAILDIYDLYENAINPEGTEVYSEIKTRRMKPAYKWNGHESTGKTQGRGRSLA
jgi:hypothetical protein